MVRNEDELYEERQKALKNRDKYVGINSECPRMSSSKSLSFDGSESRSKRALESIADEKKWQNEHQQSDLYGKINEFTSKIKYIIEKRKEDVEEQSDDDVKGGSSKNQDDKFDQDDKEQTESNCSQV